MDNQHPTDGSPPDPTASTQNARGEGLRPRDDVPTLGAFYATRNLQLGSTIGRYVINEMVGSGGMGVVYRAFDTTLHRQVALKLHLTDQGLGHSHARMLREAEALAKLNHPHVVAVHDAGRTQDGIYIAMEYVEGLSVRRWLREKKPSQNEILRVFGEAGQGLAAAHREGLIHRDIKPDNVLVNGEGHAKVIDFGLVRAEDNKGHLSASQIKAALARAESTANATPRTPSSPLHEPVTLVGTRLGTPRYMSPEQHRGHVAGPASDQFSFCLALYEALVGHRPFVESRRHPWWTRPGPPKFRHPKRRIPGPIERVLKRGLAYSADDRFASMDDLIVALSRRPRARVYGLGAAAVALMIGATAVSWARREVPAQQCRAQGAAIANVWGPSAGREIKRAFVQAAGVHGESTATRVDDAMTAMVSRWQKTHDEACNATHSAHVQSAALLDQRLACLERAQERAHMLTKKWRMADRTVVDAAVSATTRLSRSSVCTGRTSDAASAMRPPYMDEVTYDAWLNRIDEAVTLFEVGRYALAKESLSALHHELEPMPPSALLTEIGLWLGKTEERLGSYDNARKVLRDTIRDAVLAGQKSQELAVLVALIKVNISDGNYKVARAYVDAARWHLHSQSPPPIEELELLRRAAFLHAIFDEDLEAEEDLQAALTMAKQHFGRLAMADVLRYESMIRSRQGHPVRAAEAAHAALSIYTADYGSEHPTTVAVRALVDPSTAPAPP